MIEYKGYVINKNFDVGTYCGEDAYSKLNKRKFSSLEEAKEWIDENLCENEYINQD